MNNMVNEVNTVNNQEEYLNNIMLNSKEAYNEMCEDLYGGNITKCFDEVFESMMKKIINVEENSKDFFLLISNSSHEEKVVLRCIFNMRRALALLSPDDHKCYDYLSSIVCTYGNDNELIVNTLERYDGVNALRTVIRYPLQIHTTNFSSACKRKGGKSGPSSDFKRYKFN